MTPQRLVNPEQVQETLHQQVIDYIEKQSENDFAEVKARRHLTQERGHGREEIRSYLHMPVPTDLPGLELWKGLKTDDLQVISADHCPFCMKEQKELGKDDFSKIPNGAPGVEHRVPLIYNGGVVENRISLNRFVELTSTAAAKMFGLFPKKGTIAVGSDADIVIFDPDKEQTISASTHHMNVDYSAYEGKKIRGVVESVLSRGRVVVENGEFKGKAGDGQFLKRGTCAGV